MATMTSQSNGTNGDTTVDDYITVVEVDDPTSSTKDTNHLKKLVKRQSSVAEDSSFITVLTINEQQQRLQQQQKQQQEAATDAAEHVIVYRLPGERLGFGLKFQGGTRNTELVEKLYIQSCAADSPASKVATSWGHLREGDEILNIDGSQVSELTRIECVRGLKDNVAIKLIVRNGHGQKPPSEEESATELCISLNAQPPPPPPVPPRKLVKRQNSKEAAVQLCIEKPLTPPPDAEYYINLFAESLKAGSESDDTASTISTVIDKFSMSSNYSSDTELASSLELAKLVQPFTLLEQEFQLEQPLPKLLIPGNNYENVEFKTEKVNVYENVELTPTPKPRVQLASVEPKKRSIIPMPRKLATHSKQPIEVSPPRVPDSPKTLTKECKDSKIPKSAFSRAKTEGEIKLQLKQPLPQLKSRIPIVSSPVVAKPALVASKSSPAASSNIPRLLQKQKSETDLSLGLYRSKSKESSPSPTQLRAPLQRANSVEATPTPRTPERTFIPVLSSCKSNANSSESLSSNCSSSSSSVTRSSKGPKPKPPERVQSLQKTQIPKLQTALPTTPPTQQPKLSMQTFKQPPATPRSTPVNTPSPSSSNREIRFKIQTYESKQQHEDKLPSLFDLVHKQDTTEQPPTQAPAAHRDIAALLAAAAAEAADLSRESPPPLVVGKCTKIVDDADSNTCYSSSSSDDDDAEQDEADAAEREYICEDGEKLGPPELINGPGPSEAYFNMYWHSNMLPTIGEVEEEFSSLEPQSLTNGANATVEESKKLPTPAPPPQYVQPPQKVPQQTSNMEAAAAADKIVDAKQQSNCSETKQSSITTKIVSTKTFSSSTSSTSTSTSTSFMSPSGCDVVFKLQPYDEREAEAGSTTIREERRVVSEQQTLSELRTTDALTGEEQLLTSAESKSSSSRFKKISSNDNLLDLAEVEQLQPLTASVSAETKLTERLENPKDKQSIEKGTLNLSECGKQLQLNDTGLVYTECEQTEQQTYIEGQQLLNAAAAPLAEQLAEATLQRELSETLIVCTDGEKQLSKRHEQSKETAKKGAKLLKKTDEERRLEQEAQKLIDSYQKVKKEAEKLYQQEQADDEQGFDLSAFEQQEEPPAELLDEELGYVLHKHIIEAKPKPKPPLPSSKPKLPAATPIVKPKTAPPAPPVPSKRSEQSLQAKPTPTQRRRSLEPQETQSQPQPLERIIVGVEQLPNSQSSDVITLASVDLPNVACNASPVHENLLAQATDLLQDELQFESHQLPNAVRQPTDNLLSDKLSDSADESSSTASTPVTTPILVSATSSLDSVKSVIELINGHRQPEQESAPEPAPEPVNETTPQRVTAVDDDSQSHEIVQDVSALMLNGAPETGM